MEKGINILIAGDFCPKDRVASMIGTPEEDSILQDVRSIISQSDLAIVNLECPLVRTATKPIVKEGPHLKSSSAAAKILKEAGFSLITMSNNHILDYGETGLNETIHALHETGLEYVGVGKNSEEAGKTWYLKIDNSTIAVINCCEHEFSIATKQDAGANPLHPIRQWYAIQEAKQKADYVIIIVHGGHEHYALPSPRMQETYRFFIDAGADVVVNHHQHCYSGYEMYQGKPIFYGLGNFCFDWNGKRQEAWNYGYMVELHFKQTIEFTIYPYEQCNEMPVVKFLNEEQKSIFDKNIQKLNTIIASKEELTKNHEQWMQQEERNWLVSLSPFTNRYINGLTRRGMLPLWLPNSKIVSLLNKVSCESHRDKLVYILEKQI